MLPRTKFLSSVDEVPGFCWDAVINTVCLTVALVPLLLHSLPTVFNRQISWSETPCAWRRDSLHPSRSHFELEAFSGFQKLDFFLKPSMLKAFICRPAALDWLALQSDQRAPLPKPRFADTSAQSPLAPGPLPAPAEMQSEGQHHKQSIKYN